MTYDDDDVTFKIVLNEQRHAAFWPADQALPPGWVETGRVGSKEECRRELDRLEWTSPFVPGRGRRPH
jgi:MbtH protein